MNISATSGPITTKFYLKHHWAGGKAALGFGPDRIKTLVSMATESSHRVIMEKTVSRLFFIRSFSYLQAMMTCMRARTSLNFGLIGPWTAELAALDSLKKIPIGLLWEKRCLHFFSAFLDQILFILAGKDNIHDSLDKFEIWPDPTIGFHGNR